jgi:hypothetical protein
MREWSEPKLAPPADLDWNLSGRIDPNRLVPDSVETVKSISAFEAPANYLNSPYFFILL